VISFKQKEKINQFQQAFRLYLSASCSQPILQYESEGFHCLCRDELGIQSIIPTTDRGRPRADGKPRPVRVKYRKLMKQRFPKKTFGQRWQIETVFSMLKRNMRAALRARNYRSQTREIRLRILTHNLAILWRQYDVLYRAG
jgi:hypothetical protein